LRDNNHQPPAEQFVLVEDAARLLNLNSKILRRGIACGLVPIRLDNSGTVRIHLDEVPDELEKKLEGAVSQPDLHAVAQTDEIASLEKKVTEADEQRVRLEELVQKQGATLARYAALLETNESDSSDPHNALAAARQLLTERDAEVQKLSSLLDRTFRAIDARDRQVAEQSDRLAGSAEKAMNLLARALDTGELSTAQIQNLTQQVAATADINSRLEQELVQRNSVIDNQHGLMERMVTIAEKTPAGSTAFKPRKRTLWQRLWGGGRGI